MTTMAMMTKKKMITKLMTMADTKPISFVLGDYLPQSSFANGDDNADNNDNNDDDDNIGNDDKEENDYDNV